MLPKCGARTFGTRSVWALLCASCLVSFIASSQVLPLAGNPAEPIKVKTVKPKQGAIAQFIKLPGTLIPDEKVPLYSKISGYLEEISVDKGDTVKKGDIIARLSAPEMEPDLALANAKLRAARSLVGKAQATARLATSTHKRLAALRDQESGAVTVEDVEIAEAQSTIAAAEIAIAEAEVGVAAADLKRIETMLEYLIVRAPFDGTITRRLADQGAFVAAGSGTQPIVELSQLSKLRLVFDLPERLTPFIEVGAKVEYSLAAWPGRPFNGVVARRTATIESESRTMRVEVDVDNGSGELAPGMYASLQIPLAGIEGINLIPTLSLRTVDGKTCVFIVSNGKAVKVPVETLSDAGADVVVAGPLTPDTQIIAQNSPLLLEGQPVTVEEEN
ncbi:MAG: MexH family multidrug efflux RND transporter periplasmic adaptor subunit [Candidatus Hydrogenedentota bacterium]